MLFGRRAGCQPQHAAEFFDLLFVGSGVRDKFNTVVVATAMAHDASRTNWAAGKWRRKLDGNFVARLQFHTCKHQNATFAHVIAASAHVFGGAVMSKDQPDRQIEPVPLPASENRSFL